MAVWRFATIWGSKGSPAEAFPLKLCERVLKTAAIEFIRP